jgi:hypothetical protein
MTSWDIDPYGVESVVRKTDAAATNLEGHAKAFGTHMETAFTGVSPVSACTATDPNGRLGSPIVADALSRFSEQAANVVLPGIFSHYGNVRNAAVQATEAYLRGDEQMAANAQRQVTITHRPQ